MKLVPRKQETRLHTALHHGLALKLGNDLMFLDDLNYDELAGEAVEI